jgi:acetyl-CoA carboxylase biotin carboxylase subunit
MEVRAFHKILIANRGEIALRVMKTCRALGIATVGVYSEADRHSPHILFADEAICIGPAPTRDSYLRIDRIISAARLTGAEAIHPGYGFLSENAEFAEKCAQADLVFIGPSPETIRSMGLKSPARRLVRAAGVAVIPGYDGDGQGHEKLTAEAQRLGMPVLIKASAGGGGKGMRVVRDVAELDEAIDAARREAEKAFGDGSLLLEKYLENARHIEVQILGDEHGNLYHLFERDCSLQRRHQKVIEECPSPAVSPELRARICQAAVKVGRAIGYTNAGTVEFLLIPEGDFYFIEVNTRLQVEHPVTEMVTGLDLVRLQIEIAEGRRLSFGEDQLKIAGHAIEARLYAEDPRHDFLPATGHVRVWQPVAGIEGVRIDSGIETGVEVGINYDPLLAKLIAHGDDRESARRKLSLALQRLTILGLTTNREFLIELLEHADVRAGHISTEFITEHLDQLVGRDDEDARLRGAVVTAAWLQRSWQVEQRRLVHLPPSYRNNPVRRPSIEVQVDRRVIEVSWENIEQNKLQMWVGERQFSVLICEWRMDRIRLEIDGIQDEFWLNREGARFDWQSSRDAWRVMKLPRFPAAETSGGDLANAPMPGQVLKILVEPGQHVSAGDPLVILEAMKMEQTVRASVAGVVEEILIKTGDIVSPGDLLVHIQTS